MPHVLSELEGVKKAVFKNVEDNGRGRQATLPSRCSSNSSTVAPGRLTAAEYDAFVRDTVNFLDYAGEPTQVEAPRARRVGRAVPAGVHVARVSAEEGILERRPLIGRVARERPAPLTPAGAETCRADDPS